MKTLLVALAILFAAMIPFRAVHAAGPSCSAKPLADAKVAEIVTLARSKRPDLPVPLPNAATSVTRDRCFYTYRESRPDAGIDIVGRTFVIDQHGNIMAAFDGNTFKSTMTCPSKEPTLQQLEGALARERASDSSLPRAPAQAGTKIVKSGCLFLLWETPLPEAVGRYNIFTFDANAELYRVDVALGSQKQN